MARNVSRPYMHILIDDDAVNEIELTKKAAGSNPSVGVAGDDTNIDLELTAKGTGTVAPQVKLEIGNDIEVASDMEFKDTPKADAVAAAIKVVKVTKNHDSDLFNAAGLTDNVTIWQQPAGTVLLGVKSRLETNFTGLGTVAFSGAAAATDVVTVGIDGDDTVLTEGTDWDRGASKEASALSLAAAISALTGLSATSAAGATVTVTPDTGYVLTELIDTTDGGAVMTAAFLSSVVFTIGLAGDEDGLVATTGNLTTVAEDTEMATRGAYWDTSAEGAFWYAAANTDWKVYATSIGKNLDQTTAGVIDFFFTYLEV